MEEVVKGYIDEMSPKSSPVGFGDAYGVNETQGLQQSVGQIWYKIGEQLPELVS